MDRTSTTTTNRATRSSSAVEEAKRGTGEDGAPLHAKRSKRKSASPQEHISSYRIAEVAALIGNPARATIMITLLDGTARPASELSQLCGLTPGTTSIHLQRLCEGNLLRVIPQGRHRYFCLANDEVAHVLESLSLSLPTSVTLIPKLFDETPLRRARTCYRHLAGRLGVRLFSRLNEIGGLRIGPDGVYCTPTATSLLRESGLAADTDHIEELAGKLCIDWTERQPHLSGKLGKYLLENLLDAGWLRTDPKSRALFVSPVGSALEDHFVLHDHEADDAVASFRKLFDAIAKSVIGHDARVQLARER